MNTMTYKHTLILFSLAALVGVILLAFQTYKTRPIKVGILYSQTGTMAISESGMVDAALVAIRELNNSGGILGREIIPIIEDGASDPKVFASKAKDLITQKKVDVVFGCWTSSCRKSVKPVFEKHNHLLYYALQFEGMETSKNIIYLGAVPNQQLVPALEWAFNEYGKRIYLIGSDYIYPRAANEVIKDHAKQWRGSIAGESYVSLGETDFTSVIEDIVKNKPDVIFNTVNGSSNVHFFTALREAKIKPADIPTFSFSISEEELEFFRAIDMEGDYLVWNYLQSSNGAKNKEFLEKFGIHNNERRLGNPMMTVYMAVHLWAKAVQLAGTSETEIVRMHASDLSINGPSGMLYVENDTQYTWKTMHIGKITNEHTLQSEWHSGIPIAPHPFPDTRSKKEWESFLNKTRNGWGGYWQATDLQSDLKQNFKE